MLFRFMSSHTNTSWLLCFNMAPSPRGTAKHFTKASGEENFATSQAPRGAAHVTRSDAPAPSAIAPAGAERGKGGPSSAAMLRGMEVGLLHPRHPRPSGTVRG